MEIVKAVIPAAGMGSRFLPFTKAVPKELLPLINKPAIHHVVDEAIASAVSSLIFITSRGKNAIEDYFDAAPELEALLKESGKTELLAGINRLMKHGHFTFIRQPEPHGLGHAVLMAQQSIGKEYFTVMLPDDLIMSETPALSQLIRVARQERASVIAVQEVPREMVSQYGIIGIRKTITPNLFHVGSLVEKPAAKDAPSNLAIVGRYVLSHKIFASLEEVSTYTPGELQLTDGIAHMLHNNERVFAYKVHGRRYDLGNPIGWVNAIIHSALEDPAYAPHVVRMLRERELLTPGIFSPSFDKSLPI